jgi:hypothetical protein
MARGMTLARSPAQFVFMEPPVIWKGRRAIRTAGKDPCGTIGWMLASRVLCHGAGVLPACTHNRIWHTCPRGRGKP